MLELQNISKKWQDFNLDNINLAINEGEFFVILGPSGAGKTLLLELIAGIHYADKGKIIYNGKDITLLPPHKRNCGFVFQDSALFPNKKAWKNIAYGIRLQKGIKYKKVMEKVMEFLKLFKIEHVANRYPSTLSGGEKQRVALARALIINPNILLLDEPLASVDYNTMVQLKGEIKRIHKEFKPITIYVTHNRLEAMSLADRIAVMNKGKIIQVGTPDEIFRNPQSEFVAKFIGFDNIFSGTAKFNKEIGLSEIQIDSMTIYSADKLYGNVKVCIRPEDIILSRQPLKSSMRNVINGTIVKIDDLGTLFEVSINIGTIIKVLITQNALLDLGLSVGSKIYVNFKSVALKTIM
ncbi:MAG: tungstate ABC transporter ATP-binding protein WtpC [Candidatus Helarchaeota archaeon]